MNTNHKLTCAILAALGASTVATTAAMAADEDALADIIVTAQRRNESIQDVPITIQAVTGDTLKQLHIQTFDDLIRYTPNVTSSGNGPGTGNIFMRGLSSGGSGNQSQSTTAPFPNVALYLDDQSMQFPARNNDVYMVDMERVEVLEGPQGTLFGGGSQAGAIRYITNKPKINVTEGNVSASYGITAGGDPNTALNATINLPLIADHLSLRATIFTDRRGGWIDNEPGTIQVPATTTTIPQKTGPALVLPRPASAIGNNADLVGSNLNSVDYQGARISLLYQFNDDWNFLVQQNYQHMEADGYFQTEPVAPDGQVLGPNQTEAFSPNYDKDKYESTAWTLNGKISDWLKMVYTGSYMVRSIDQQGDYSNYLRSKHGSYYDCTGQAAGYAYFRSSKPTTCYAPIGSWRDQVQNSHQSHELRFSTNEDARVRSTFGAFWEEFVIKDNMNFNYMPMPQCDATNLAIALGGGPDCVSAVGPVPGFYASDPSPREGTNTAFGEDVKRGYRQFAEFGSVDFDILPKILTVTAGTRHYHYSEFEEGSEYYSATSTILNVPNGSQVNHAGFGMNLNKTESGFKSRANITWHITPDVMAYYTWSQGFRPGGFNRTATNEDGSVVKLKAVAPYTPGGFKQFDKPAGYDSDNLVNNELGLKTQFFNHRLEVNASVYQMDWKNVQLPLFDPVHLGNTTFDINGPSYRVRGVELQIVGKLFEGFTLQGSGSWNSSSQTNAPCLAANVPGGPTPLGQCITQVNGNPYTNPYGVLGTAPPFSPPSMWNLRGRYDFPAFTEYKPFASVGVNHIASMRNEPASFPDGNDPAYNPPTTTLLKYEMPGYTTYDASVGVSKDAWTLMLSGVNLGNNNSSTNTSSGQFIKLETPLRPRVLTATFEYKF